MRKHLRYLPKASIRFFSIISWSLTLDFRKKLLVKIFAGPIWEDRLLAFVETFTNRRKEFEFALTIHTAVGVDEANIKLNTVDLRTADLNQKCVAQTSIVWLTTDNSG